VSFLFKGVVNQLIRPMSRRELRWRHKSVGRRVFLVVDIWLGSSLTPDGVAC
jgi:hypothetical protein